MNKKILLSVMMPLLLLAVFVFAGAGEGNLVIDEDSLSFTTDPGVTLQGQFTINESTVDLTGIVVSEVGSFDSMVFEFPEAFDILAGEEKIVDFNVTIPATTPNATYEGVINVTATEGDYDELNLTIDVNAVNSIEIDSIDAITINPDSNESITFNVTNTGNTDLKDLVISEEMDTNIDDGYYGEINLGFSETLITLLEIGATQEITLTVNTEEDAFVYNDYNWDINVSNDVVGGFVDLEVAVESEIFSIFDFKVEDSKVEPGEDFDVSLDIDNVFDEDIEDIIITTVIIDMEDGSGDDLESETSNFDLDEGKGDDKSFNDFEVPYNVEAGYYTIELVVEGEGKDSGDNYEVNFLFMDELEVDKDEDDEVVFLNTTIDPETIECGEELSVETTIVNTGMDDQDDMYLILVVSDIDIEDESISFDLDGDDASSNNDRETDKSFVVTIPEDAEEGTHTLYIYAYDEDDNRLGDISKTFTIEGSECVVSEDDPSDGEGEVEISLEDQVVSAEQEETFVVLVTVTNNGDSTENEFEISVTGHEGFATLIDVTQPEADIQPGEESIAYVTLLVDDDAEANTYQITITLEEDNEEINTETLIVTVEGDESESGSTISGEDITGFTSFIDSIGSIDFTSSLIVLGDLLLLVVIIFFIKAIVTKKK